MSKQSVRQWNEGGAGTGLPIDFKGIDATKVFSTIVSVAKSIASAGKDDYLDRAKLEIELKEQHGDLKWRMYPWFDRNNAEKKGGFLKLGSAQTLTREIAGEGKQENNLQADL